MPASNHVMNCLQWSARRYAYFQRPARSASMQRRGLRERSSSMSTIGKVDSLWRYPVKSMRGQELDETFVGFSGVYGDRLFAFKSTASPKGFPYLTGREQQKMLRYRPLFR